MIICQSIPLFLILTRLKMAGDLEASGGGGTSNGDTSGGIHEGLIVSIAEETHPKNRFI